MTVTELRGRLTFAEFRDWQTYAEEMGPLNSAVRIEWAVARGILPFLSKEAKIRDFAPYPKEQEKEADINDVARLLTGIAKMGKTNGR